MASFFTSKRHRWKSVPNGGLGGVVCPSEDTVGKEGIDVSPTCRSKQQTKPPPILTSSNARSVPMTPSQRSAVSAGGFQGFWSPKTPNDGVWPTSPVVEEKDVVSSLLLSRYVSAAPSEFYHSLPDTPGSVLPKLNSRPAELPGSLLLPSQGFQQSDPIAPPPSHRLLRRDTEESNTSSVPTLSTSISSDDIDMEALRSLTIPLRKNDRTEENTMPTYIIGSRNTQDAQISKPFSAMSIEELLEQLPHCNAWMINQLWLPAIRVHIEKMAQLLDDAGQMKIESSINEISLNKVMGFILYVHWN